MPLEGLLVNHRNITFIYRPLPFFNITRRKCWVLCPFRKLYCWFEKMLVKRVDIWANINFSKVFGNVGRRLTRLKFSFISFLQFLCTCVTLANFQEERKHEDLIALLMLIHKKSTYIWIFSLIILVGILFFWEALVLSNLRISFLTSPIFTSSKCNVFFLCIFEL